MFYNELKKPVKHFKETEGGRRQVCKAMEERIERERIDSLLEVVKNLMENLHLSATQAMIAMGVSEEDKERILKKI